MFKDIFSRNIPELISFLCGLYCLVRLNWSYRMVLLLVTAGLLTQVLGQVISRNFTISNHELYNYYILVSSCGWLYVAWLLQNRKHGRVYLFGVLVCVAVWMMQVAKDGIGVFANYAYAVQSLVLVLFFLHLLYHTSVLSDDAYFRRPALWVCLAVIIFYGCNIPYMSMMKFLNYKDANGSYKLYSNITKVSKAVFYLFLAGSMFAYYSREKRLNPAKE